MQPKTAAYLQQVVSDLQAVTAMVRQDGLDAKASGDHVAVIKHFDTLRKAMDDVKIAREALSDMADMLSKQTIPEIIEDLRQRTGQKPPFNIEGVGRVSVARRFSASIIDGAMGMPGKVGGHNWLKENDYGDLVTETVNSSTLAAFAKNLIEDQGIDLPPDIFKVGAMPYTSITKA